MQMTILSEKEETAILMPPLSPTWQKHWDIKMSMYVLTVMGEEARAMGGQKSMDWFMTLCLPKQKVTAPIIKCPMGCIFCTRFYISVFKISRKITDTSWLVCIERKPGGMIPPGFF